MSAIISIYALTQ